MKGQFKVNGSGFQPITKISITRRAILERSMQEFDDDDPCIIHETHCRMKIAFDLTEIIESNHQDFVGREAKIWELPSEIRKVLCYEDNETIEFR